MNMVARPLLSRWRMTWLLFDFVRDACARFA